MLVYSVTLGNWQGIWCFEQGTTDVGFRDSARDRTNPSATLFLVAQPNGVISQFTYPVLRQYFDQDLALVHHTYDSSLVTRSFTFGLFSMTAQYIPQMNQIQPHSVKIQFLESVDDVTVTILVDRYSEVLKTVSQTSGSYLVLPIAAIPFDLDVIGYFYLPLSLMSVGICDEVQVQLEGDGNWTVFQVRLAAYEYAPLETV